MKLFITLVAFLTVAIAHANGESWQDLSSKVFTNAKVVWQVPSNALPKNLWVYRRLLPHVFSATVISNAIILGSLQNKGFPKPSTNDFFIPEDKGPGYPGPLATIFGIRPRDANIYFSIPNYGVASGEKLPDDQFIIAQAWKYAPLMGLDSSQLAEKNLYTHLCDGYLKGQETTQPCGRGVFLSRQLDGISFFSGDNEGSDAEGFSIEFGGFRQIRSFSVRWSKVVRYESQQIANKSEITRCILAHKAIVMPIPAAEDYFALLKKLAGARKLTITKITPYYGDFMFGEVPTNDVPCEFATPFAELEAVADFGTNNAPVTLLSPITSSEVNGLLKAR